MTKKQKKMLIRIIIAAVLVLVLRFVPLPVSGFPLFLLWLIPYFVIGYDILRKAWKGILNRQVFDENFLMAVATLGALAIGLLKTGDYDEAVAVMLFYQIGELFQSYAVGKSRRNISELMDIRPDYANIEQDGQVVRVDPDEVEPGTVITVRPGEKIPIDGIVEDGGIQILQNGRCTCHSGSYGFLHADDAVPVLQVPYSHTALQSKLRLQFQAGKFQTAYKRR